ncbi:MAG: bifunctional metallophosphatase/5'-nucleotidase [Sphingobacteriia bacterium]|nr:bifunctional metallophosphatase/5'-nucleotidase [Sphingobacteriia bacterium]NCC38411.1 bifunctional metallophosphatase/5'-nucleotidase [Gammaproteobacteria bacterium]
MNPRPWSRVWLIGMVLALVCGGAAPILAETPPETPWTTRLTILHFNDFHGRLAAADPDTLSFFATLEEERRIAGERLTLVLGGGDQIGASLFASFIQSDVPTLNILNAMALDVSVVGNHELDRGYPDLIERVLPLATFPYLGANVYHRGTNQNALPPYAIFRRAGIRIGVIGAVTADAPDLVAPMGVAMLDFGDPVAAVNRVAMQLTDGHSVNGEADVIIAIYHEGASIEGTLAEQESASATFSAMVRETSPRVDVILNGHTHLAYAHQAPVPGANRPGLGSGVVTPAPAVIAPATGGPVALPSPAQTRPVAQSGAYAALIGKITLDVDRRTRRVVSSTTENLQPRPDARRDLPRVRQVAALLDRALSEAEVIGEEEIATLTAALSRAVDLGPDGRVSGDDRALESTLSNRVATMYRDRLADPGRGGARIGVQQPGGTRADLMMGPLTYAEAANVLPFASTLMTARLSGAQIKTLLEQQWQPAGASRPYLQLGLSDNVTYTFDPRRPPGERITTISLDGAPLDPAADYVVASNSFLIGGGDHFSVFDAALDRRDSGLSDLEEWIDDIKAAQVLTPSFAKQAVAVSPTPTTLTIDTPTQVEISALDFLKVLDAVPNTEVIAEIDAQAIGTARVIDGTAELILTPPRGLTTGPKTLIITANPTGTRVSIPIQLRDDEG